VFQFRHAEATLPVGNSSHFQFCPNPSLHSLSSAFIHFVMSFEGEWLFSSVILRKPKLIALFPTQNGYKTLQRIKENQTQWNKRRTNIILLRNPILLSYKELETTQTDIPLARTSGSIEQIKCLQQMPSLHTHIYTFLYVLVRTVRGSNPGGGEIFRIRPYRL
jgi:hypothetical protein